MTTIITTTVVLCVCIVVLGFVLSRLHSTINALKDENRALKQQLEEMNLKERQATESAEPLPVNYLLKHMGNPIYIKCLDDGQIVPAILAETMGGGVVAIRAGVIVATLYLRDYGKTWLACRRKPEPPKKEDKT